MQAIIDVFRMTELNTKTRVKIIKKLGEVINYDYGANVTEPIVYELVLALEPDDCIKTDEIDLRHLNQ